MIHSSAQIGRFESFGRKLYVEDREVFMWQISNFFYRGLKVVESS